MRRDRFPFPVARFPLTTRRRVPHPDPERSAGEGRRCFLCILSVFWVLCVPAFAQTADPFAAYHDSLNRVADSVLANVNSAGSHRSDVASYVATDPAVDASVSSVPSVVKPSVARVQQMRPLLEPILREEGVPAETAAVVLVESAGHPAALSPKGALGLWQLMPETARRYGLIISTTKDERLDVVKATRAAARYLRDLYAQFGDWKLAFAAYNAGGQAVQRAVQRAGSSDFLRVSALLPLETRSYVPAVTSAQSLFGDGRPFAINRAAVGRVLYADMQIGN